MQPWIAVLAALTGYLVGAISFSRIITRLVNPQADLSSVAIPVEGLDEKFKMTAMGGSTAGMVLGPRVGCLIGMLDMLKVAIPTLVFKIIFPEQPYFLIVAIAGMVGHDWPVYYGFKGGRGISAVYGGMLAIDWQGALVTSIGGMLIGMIVFHDFAIAYLSGLWLLIPWMWFRWHNFYYLAYAIIINLIFTLAMLPEIKEIIRLRRLLGSKGNMASMMEYSPMGKSMMNIARRLKIMKDPSPKQE
jgi:glycerol-3-phosphate acyltransferase PlsY